VDARFEQFFHGDIRQITSLVKLHPSRRCCPLGIDSLVRSRQSGREDLVPVNYRPDRLRDYKRQPKLETAPRKKKDGIAVLPEILSLAELEPLARALFHPTTHKTGARWGPRIISIESHWHHL